MKVKVFEQPDNNLGPCAGKEGKKSDKGCGKRPSVSNEPIPNLRQQMGGKKMGRRGNTLLTQVLKNEGR